MATIYDVKPQFQQLLRPLAANLAKRRLTANDVTLGALLLSGAHGARLALMPASRWPLLLLPVTLFLRMAFNAIDGMMAKEHGQASARGAVLNELSDVIADGALYLPFALIPGIVEHALSRGASRAVGAHRAQPRAQHRRRRQGEVAKPLR